MSASRFMLSFPGIRTNLLPELDRIQASFYTKRTLCLKCQNNQPLTVIKSIIFYRQISHVTRKEKKRNVIIKKWDAFNDTDKGLLSSSDRISISLPKMLSSCTHRQPLSLSSLSHQSFTNVQMRSFHHDSNPSFTPHNDNANTTPVLDPFKMMETEMSALIADLRKELNSEEPVLHHMSQYYFNGKGKAFRPLVSLLMAKACNIHSGEDESVIWQQKVVAMVSEMIHTASLIHDDVIDASDTRRSQASLNLLYGQRQAILTGDYILSRASIAVARTKHLQVISILASILVDLVGGEFMQLGSKENANERFAHYFDKTFKKTASLIANCCKSVAILGNCDEEIVESSFQYGRNLGVAFQLIDDLLDFTSSDVDMGKPTAADLKQGLATAPVLFAAQEFPELHPMIMRRFSQDGDVEFARNAVDKSKGVEQTRLLATQHSKEAIRNVQTLSDSEARAGLIRLAQILLERKH